jgi:hypothetical protein
MTYRAKKTNNPGNLKAGGAWRGWSGQLDQGGHLIFTDYMYPASDRHSARVMGLRALIRSIHSAVLAGRDSPWKLIAGVPPGVTPWTTTEDDWAAYASAVARSMGQGLDDSIAWLFGHPGETGLAIDGLIRIVRAMSTVEQGAGYRDRTSDILESIVLFRRDFVVGD